MKDTVIDRREPQTKRGRCVKVTITLPARLREASEILIQERGYSGFSDYVQARIRRDVGLEPSM